MVADPDRPPPRYVPLRRLVPNFITTAALCCGLASLHFAVKEDWNRALILVTLAAVLDALDGRAARLLRVSSPFGATLDSLADFISFGVAPAFLLYKWQLHDAAEPLGLIACIVFALCNALRLARFTAMDKKGKGSPWGSGYFIGMPAPSAAGAVLIPLFLDVSKKDWSLPTWLVLVHTLLIAALMVSRVPMFSMKKMKISRRWAVPLMVLFGAIVIAAARDPWLTLGGLALAYLLTIPLSVLRAKRITRPPAPPTPPAATNGAAPIARHAT